MKKRIERSKSCRISFLNPPFGFREKLMKKRIERCSGSFPRILLYLSMFQRKAHEKEDWESNFTSLGSFSPYLFCFREKLMKKRIERRSGRKNTAFHSSKLVSEKSSWKRGLRAFFSSSVNSLFFSVSEKSSWKRGLRELRKKERKRERERKFQRKAHEKEDWEIKYVLEPEVAPLLYVSEKSSWKRGLRDLVLCYTGPRNRWILRFREKLMKKRIEREKT